MNRNLICIDSDGCAVNSMEIKHRKAFATELVKTFGLEKMEDIVRKHWMRINLYSKTRGFNRFLTLDMTFDALKKDKLIDYDTSELKKWIGTADALSNDSLYSYLKVNYNQFLENVYKWSLDFNKAISEIPEEEISAFPLCRESMADAYSHFDIVVMSSANYSAVEKEWKRLGMIQYVKKIFCQENGSKTDCLKQCIEIGYRPENMIMCGDSPGDYDAATTTKVSFFPILVGSEVNSWGLFREKVVNNPDGMNWIVNSQVSLADSFWKNLAC